MDEKNPDRNHMTAPCYYDINSLCRFHYLGMFLAYYSWENLEKASRRMNEDAFSASVEEVKYEEICLCITDFPDGHLSHESGVQ
jgi:hypothetical protein